MRTLLLSIAATFACAALAAAQPAAPPPSSPAAAAGPETGYLEGVAQSAFGHVTSQSYGIEAGYVVEPQVDIFFEVGRVTDASTQGIEDSAQVITNALAGSGITATVREPVSFLAVGGKYLIATGGAFHPYVLVGAGVARVKQDVVFRTGGVDVTSTISQYGVALGGDLSGTSTKVTVMAGAGAMIPLGRRLVLDLQLRINRVLSDPAISFGRAGIGFGVRF